jgi:prepilin-type N-terminal cleavage/methylation domain-containing protein
MTFHRHRFTVPAFIRLVAPDVQGRSLPSTAGLTGRPNPRIAAPAAGFTLIELILSLTILAAVASIVLTTVAEFGERTRYEETERRGETIQAAVTGTPGAPSRFAADMGRFPLVTDTREGRELAEIYRCPYDRDAGGTAFMDSSQFEKFRYTTRFFSLREPGHYVFGGETAVPDPWPSAGEITLNAGWRGPYLVWRHATLTDNWGRPWQLNTASERAPVWRDHGGGDPARQGDEIRGIRTLGHDGIDEVDDDPGAPDTYPDEIQTYPFHENLLFAEVTVSLMTNNLPVSTNVFDRLRVFLYQPFCTTNEAGVCEIAAWLNAPTNGVVYRTQTGGTDTYAGDYTDLGDAPPAAVYAGAVWETNGWHTVTFTNVPGGVRKLWGYACKSGETHGVRSRLLSVELLPGRTHPIQLHLTEDF